MAERFDIFPQSIEGGARAYSDGSQFIEIRFIDDDGRTACVLFRPEALDLMLQQLTALRDAGGDSH